VPFEETLSAMQELVKEGKVRHIGVSNETAWGLMQYLRVHREKNLPKIQSIQNPYSLIMREFETALAEIVVKEKISLLVYSPLSFGVLTGKYLDGARPKGSRFDYEPKRNISRYNPQHAQLVIKMYVDLAKKYGLDPAQMAISFAASREFVTSVIIGATSVEQVKADIGSIDVNLSDEVMEEIETIHREHPNPLT
jgi:aryl-alcohol dehydrogenase-like predicted oxidoreductase